MAPLFFYELSSPAVAGEGDHREAMVEGATPRTEPLRNAVVTGPGSVLPPSVTSTLRVAVPPPP
jgi:hypothetical protein